MKDSQVKDKKFPTKNERRFKSLAGSLVYFFNFDTNFQLKNFKDQTCLDAR